MLRLEEDLAPFLRIADRIDALASVRQRGARLLRGTTLFEDVVTAMTTTWDLEGTPDFRVPISLCNRLGLPLPSNPTLHAFPTPDRMLADQPYLLDTLGDDTARQIIGTASTFHTQAQSIESLVRRPLSAVELGAKLSLLLPLDPGALGQVMLRLGRYDHVPTDTLARARLGRYLGATDEFPERAVQNYFEQWHPWGGLAYWLWDWSKIVEANGVAAGT
jgi:3-methyladenine DNA glycosylase/8-oxoguanine DNA glycosylase